MKRFFRGKKVLVTGGTGFVGSHFTRRLAEIGAQVRVPVHHRQPEPDVDGVEYVRGDLLAKDDCKRLCKGVNVVIHAAGGVGASGVTAQRQLSGICDNLVLTARIVEAAVMSGVSRLLLFSSSTTYPVGDRPFKEEDMWEGDVHPSYLGYGWMRRYFEMLGRYVCESFRTSIAVCRPTAIYGPGDNFGLYGSHVLAALIRRAVAGEKPFVVWGKGSEVRDFLHIRDLVRGCLLLAASDLQCGEPVNIGSGLPVTIREVAELVLEAAGRRGEKIVFDREKPTTIPIRRVDISKAERLLGFSPAVPLVEGIAETCDWYRHSRQAGS